MEIKLKLKEVVNINKTLSTIIDDSEIKINVLLKFRLLGIMKAVESFTTNYEIVRNEKIVEYGEKNKDGTYQIPKDDKESIEKYLTEINQVLDSEVVINIEPIKPEEIIDKGLKSDYLIALFPIIRQ